MRLESILQFGISDQFWQKNVWFEFGKTKSKLFISPNLKNRVSVKNNDKISVARMFLDPIDNRVSVKSVYVEAVYLEALLYIEF